MSHHDCHVAVVGAGIAGIATAYYLCVHQGITDVLLLDGIPPMSLTSAQSGENYRNWWPHPVMTQLTNDSIDLMEELARRSGNRLHMTRRGYALATRSDANSLIAELHHSYGADADGLIRVHDRAVRDRYSPAASANWEAAPDGVDILRGRALLRRHFPGFAPDIATVVHIRRAGDISSQQMAQYMLEHIREVGGKLVAGRGISFAHNGRFLIDVAGHDAIDRIRCEVLVNAAGPFVGAIASRLGVDLPVRNVLQQKIAFADTAGAIPRQMPFSIDLDAQSLDWTPDEREILSQDPETAWLAAAMPGAIHCRPDGGDQGRWIKLGWAYNHTPADAEWVPQLDDHFPEVVLRGAARLHPALKTYYGRIPREFAHYGGYYTMTDENWPLIGPMGVDGAFVVGALSGFGTMAACAAGALCAGSIAGGALPDYARELSPARYGDPQLMSDLAAASSKGLL
jgi:glycine/D-amino acid oxidase-like deaminating enzyme